MGKSKSNRATGVWPIRGRRHQAWLRRVASSRRVGGITRSNSTARRRGCGRRFSWGPALAQPSQHTRSAAAAPLPPIYPGPQPQAATRIGTSLTRSEAVASSYGTTVAGAGSARRERSGIRGAAPVQSLMPHCPQHNRRHRWTMADLPWVACLRMMTSPTFTTEPRVGKGRSRGAYTDES